jgi:DNA-binding PadR family transcriptional regulator
MSLRPIEFQILLALASDERHGYAILQEVSRLTEGDLELEPGTL